MGSITRTIANNLTTDLGGAGGINFRNIIINGDMSIAQRGTSATGLGSGDSGYHTCDRWKFTELGSATAEFTQTQSTDVPAGQGFATSLKMDCTTADASLNANISLDMRTIIEGQNLQFLKKGTSSAESLTLSFWVKSNKTGTYISEIRDVDNDRGISQAYTISSSNTWEKKTITIDGDTTGALDNDNARSLDINFWLGAGTDYTSGTLATSWVNRTNANRAVGQVNLADNTANEWYITGIQLEAGTTASDFEFLPFDVNLGRCQRYYYNHVNGSGQTIGVASYFVSTQIEMPISFPVSMRAAPSVISVTGTDYYYLSKGSPLGADYFNSIVNIFASQKNGAMIYNNDVGQISGTQGQAYVAYTNNAGSFISFNAEL